jgi:FHA domain-containing protein
VDAVDVLIFALRLVFVALLYLFLLAVLRMAFRATRPQSAQTLSLRVLEPGASTLQPGEILDLTAGTTLGRGSRADLVLADTAVSGEHARVERDGRRWIVIDLDSTNGTRLNDSTIRGRAALSVGDVLSLGTVRLEVVAR